MNIGSCRSALQWWVCLAVLPVMLIGQEPSAVPNELPALATTQLAKSLADSRAHATHVWRDTAPFNEDGTVNAYIEIARGDRRKWEFDMSRTRGPSIASCPNVGGYPVNYGFVPQTVSYDGDPFDVLVLGPPTPGGRVVRGVIVGLMFMEDEKGLDAKVVVSDGTRRAPAPHAHRPRSSGHPTYFRRYKQHEPGKFSKVPGWGSVAEGLAHVTTTHAFFSECRERSGTPCRVRSRHPAVH